MNQSFIDRLEQAQEDERSESVASSSHHMKRREYTQQIEAMRDACDHCFPSGKVAIRRMGHSTCYADTVPICSVCGFVWVNADIECEDWMMRLKWMASPCLCSHACAVGCSGECGCRRCDARHRDRASPARMMAAAISAIEKIQRAASPSQCEIILDDICRVLNVDPKSTHPGGV